MSTSRSLIVVVSLLSGIVSDAAERNLRVADGARSVDPTQKEMYKGPNGALPPTKSPSSGMLKQRAMSSEQ